MINSRMPPDQRLEDWQRFRNLLPSLPEEEQLSLVAEYWSEVPLSNWVIDDSDPASWVTPWELLYEGDYCPTTISYLMQQTLHLSDTDAWSEDRLKLVFVRDSEQDIMRVVLVVDDKHVLNYDYGLLFDWNKAKQTATVIRVVK